MEVRGPPSGQQDTGFLWPSREQPVLSVLSAGLPHISGPWTMSWGLERGIGRQSLESLNMAHFSIWPSKDPEHWSPRLPVRRVQKISLEEPPNPGCHQPFHKAQPHHCGFLQYKIRSTNPVPARTLIWAASEEAVPELAEHTDPISNHRFGYESRGWRGLDGGERW